MWHSLIASRALMPLFATSHGQLWPATAPERNPDNAAKS
jgi:hypothetical protein